jgi:hypothetical protein
MVTSAAVTTAAVVSEGEKLVQNPDTENSVIVRNDSQGDSRREEACQRQGTLPEADRSRARDQQDSRSRCTTDSHEPESLGEPNRPKT